MALTREHGGGEQACLRTTNARSRAEQVILQFLHNSTPLKGSQVSLHRNRLAGLWSLPGALTSHIVLHFLRFSDTFRGAKIGKVDRDQYLAP